MDQTAVTPGTGPAGPRRWAHLLEASEDRGIGADLPARSWVFDVLLAVVFTGVGSVFLPVFYPEADGLDFVFVAAVSLPLLLRRRLPKAAFAVVMLAGLAQIALRPVGIHDGALLFALYSLVGFSNRRVGLIGLGVTVVVALIGSATDWWGFIDEQLTGGHPTLLVNACTLLGMIALVVASWATGERLRSARTAMSLLAERADTLEREQEQQARLAAADERARIAREMHDVIAHALSVMIAQADGAGYVLDTSPGQAHQALERISRTGRESLGQMRGLLGLLREGGQPDARTPTPGLDRLPELIEDAENSGLRVLLRQSGRRRGLEQLISLTVYRIVQEGLNNARRHGGAEVGIELDYRTDGVAVTIENAAPAAGPATRTTALTTTQTTTTATTQTTTAGPGSDLAPAGYGLIGMAERVGAVGGTLRTGVSSPAGGSATGAGFRIEAWLPYDARVPADVPADPVRPRSLLRRSRDDTGADPGVPGRRPGAGPGRLRDGDRIAARSAGRRRGR